MKTLFFVLVFLALSGAVFVVYREEKDAGAILVTAQKAAVQNPEVANPIAAKVAEMSLEEKIGQMLIVGFGTTVVDAHITEMITRYHIGGINLLKRNVRGREQMLALTAELQGLAKIPLFIAADQEGGTVARFSFLSELASQRDIDSEEEAEAIAERRAKELAELGVNMNFSPVADYVNDPDAYLYDRTFGRDPETIGRFGEAMVRGYLRGGVIPVVKHFPGYGSIMRDPHRDGVARTDGVRALAESMVPFAAIIARYPEGAVMTAHISVPEIDTKPATLSSTFLTQILRERLGFRGVIITDDVEMISAGTSPVAASLEAVKAGADMIISTYMPEIHIAIYNRLYEAVRSGEITEVRIDESVERILRLKAALPGGQ